MYVLPRRKDFMKAAGLLSSHIDSVEATKVDSKYMLAKTVWNMRVRANNGNEVRGKTSATYILSIAGDSLEIVFQETTRTWRRPSKTFMRSPS